MKTILILCVVLLLNACGGGGGSGDSTTTHDNIQKISDNLQKIADNLPHDNLTKTPNSDSNFSVSPASSTQPPPEIEPLKTDGFMIFNSNTIILLLLLIVLGVFISSRKK